jgi:lipoic acid synthetase
MILFMPTRAPQILVEALTGDMAGNLDHVSVVARSGLDVYAHNVETVEALTPFVRDRRATFRQSLSVLERAKQEGVRVTKTSIMLGVGETEDQVMDALRGQLNFSLIALPAWPISAELPTELRKVDVDVVTFGQYMRPTKKHMKVDRYVEPAEFDRWRQIAEDMGFLYVASGPLVRSSYKVGIDSSHARFSLILLLQAGEYFIENVLRNKGAEKRSQKLSAQHTMTDSDSTLLT